MFLSKLRLTKGLFTVSDTSLPPEAAPNRSAPTLPIQTLPLHCFKPSHFTSASLTLSPTSPSYKCCLLPLLFKLSLTQIHSFHTHSSFSRGHQTTLGLPQVCANQTLLSSFILGPWEDGNMMTVSGVVPSVFCFPIAA